VLGEALGIIWPLWRWNSFRDLEKFAPLFTKSRRRHSKAMSSEEIFNKYGVH